MVTRISTKNSVAVLAVSTLGLGASVSGALPAQALSVDGCGDQPTGGTLTLSGDICQVVFDSAGSYTYTLPTGISGLYALLVGAGGGGLINGTPVDEYYAGEGGSVSYVDYSTASSGEVLTISVGGGGTTAVTPTAGAPSTVTRASVTSTAAGGAGGSLTDYCSITGSVYVGHGHGSRTDASSGSDACTDVSKYGRGIIPSLAHPDSASTSVPSILSGINTEFGHGGRILVDTTHQSVEDGTGWGAGVTFTSGGTLVANDATGADGAVIFRFPSSSSSGSNSGSSDTSIDSQGIFLFLAGSPGSPAEGCPVYYGSVSIKPNTTYILSIQSVTNPALTRTVLATGTTNNWGHADKRLEMGKLAPGTYKVVMTGTHRLDYPLVLTNYISVDRNGNFISLSPESLQPTLS